MPLLRSLLLLALLPLVGADTVNAPPAIHPGKTTHQKFSFGHATYPYLVFAPASWTPDSRFPALLLIHGAQGRGEDMLSLWRDFADQHGILVIAPTFPLDARFETTVPVLYPALMETVRQSTHFDPRRAYIFGYSAGGYTTFDAATLTSYFAGAAVFADIIAPGYESIVDHPQRHTPIALYLGDHDPFFTFAQSRRTRDLLLAHGFPVHYVEIPHQDHNYPAVANAIDADAWSFMSRSALP